MKLVYFGLLIVFLLSACDASRIYETNNEFEGNVWRANDVQEFEFEIPDASQAYNLYFNLRNEVEFEKTNVLVQVSLQDSLDTILDKVLLDKLLFEVKTGKPLGNSSIGDVYSHQFLYKKGYKFSHPGKFKLSLQHYMRVDSLVNIPAVGIRIEKEVNKTQ